MLKFAIYMPFLNFKFWREMLNMTILKSPWHLSLPPKEIIMYQYSYTDQKIVDERVEQFRDQTQRFLAGELPEE